ncbi:MAG: hypothetical protein GX958_12450, partial [Desulfitobacterium sp.]|nr:hypothetical protein [Desulfitobacterium sp.]
ISIISHGSSKEKAIFNAIRVAKECVESRFIEEIEEKLPRFSINKSNNSKEKSE